MKITCSCNDNSAAYINALQERLPVALEACGLAAERFAKLACPVDTGLLRNSITHAVSGQAISGNYHATYGSHRKNGKRIKATSKNAGSVGFGSYSFTLETPNKVIVGTNVQYAPYVELGHRLPSGRTVKPRPFLRPAIENHKDQYKAIIKAYLNTD